MDEPTPRIPNLPRSEWTPEAREVFAFWGEPDAYENGSKTNTMMTMAQHPRLANAHNEFSRQLLLASTLPARQRELVVLRICWHLGAAYEWHYHVGYALNVGITLDEIDRLRTGPSAPGWKEDDRAVLQAADDLWFEDRIADATWAALTDHFERRQLMELVFVAANYVMFTWAINSFGIPLESGVDQVGFDLRTRSGGTPGRKSRPGASETWAADPA